MTQPSISIMISNSDGDDDDESGGKGGMQPNYIPLERLLCRPG